MYQGNLLPEIDIIAVSICNPFNSECSEPDNGEFCPESRGNKQFLLGSVKFIRQVTASYIPSTTDLENRCVQCDSSCPRKKKCALANLFKQDVLDWASWAFGIEDPTQIKRALFVRALNAQAKNRLRQINVYFKDFNSIFQEMYQRLNNYTAKFGRETTDEFITMIGWLRELGLLEYP